MTTWARIRPELDASGMEVFGRLHRAFLQYRSAIQSCFSELGSTIPGFDVLAALRRAQPRFTLTAGELAQQTLVTTGGLTLRVKRLEEEGFVVRHRDDADHRIVHVQLTASGLHHVDRVADAHFANLSRLLGGLDASERHELARLLERLLGSMSEHGGD